MLANRPGFSYLVGMNRLPTYKRELILQMLVEGASMRSVSRTVDVSINTVKKLQIEVGQIALQYHDEHVCDVVTKRVECDEIWSFCYARRNNVKTAEQAPEYAGDLWTWTALDTASRMILTYEVGDRSMETALSFMRDLRKRVLGTPQIVTDGLPSYPVAVNIVFGGGHQGTSETSHVERHNLSMRMGMRRYTRRTNGFSKRLDRYVYSLANFMLYYNFIRPHLTPEDPPAVYAGVANRPLTWREVLEMVDENSN